jgi:hypothetical protein
MKRKHKNKKITAEPAKKMSEILLDFAWEYAIKDVPDLVKRQHFMDIACFAWNCSLLPVDNCQNAIASFIENMRARRGNVDDTVEVHLKAIENDIRGLIAWKKDHYLNVRKVIVSAELYAEEGDKLGCRITSGDYDAMLRAQKAR